MKLVIYIIIVVAWILISNYQRVQARKKKKQSGHAPHEDTSESYTEELPAPKQKDLLEEILSQWTTSQPTVEASPKPLPEAIVLGNQSAAKPRTTKHLVQPKTKSTREFAISNIETIMEDEISPDYIAQTEGIELSSKGVEFNLKQAVIHATILNRPDF